MIDRTTHDGRAEIYRAMLRTFEQKGLEPSNIYTAFNIVLADMGLPYWWAMAATLPELPTYMQNGCDPVVAINDILNHYEKCKSVSTIIQS